VACALFLAEQTASTLTGMVATDEDYIARYGLKVPALPAAGPPGEPSAPSITPPLSR